MRVSCFFGILAALWGFLFALLGGACCCFSVVAWLGLPLAILALILAIASLCLERTAFGWTGLALSILGVIVVLLWPILAPMIEDLFWFSELKKLLDTMPR